MLRALQIAAPEQYIRAFLDEDRALIDLLTPFLASAPDFIQTVLAAASDGGSRAAPTHPQLQVSDAIRNDPLTLREREVLVYIAAGYTNAQIARQLSITIATVKRHINSIYSKLAVQNRTQAIIRGQHLRLIEERND